MNIRAIAAPFHAAPMSCKREASPLEYKAGGRSASAVGLRAHRKEF